MKLKDIYEELSSPIAKEKYRELVKIYHPDMPKGNQSIIRNINNAKDAGDEELLDLYKKLTKKKVEENPDKVVSDLKKAMDDFIKSSKKGKGPTSWETSNFEKAVDNLKKFQAKRRRKASMGGYKPKEDYR